MTLLQWAGYLVWLAVLVLGFPREFWPKFKSEKDYQHLVMASILMLFLLWNLRAGIAEALICVSFCRRFF